MATSRTKIDPTSGHPKSARKPRRGESAAPPSTTDTAEPVALPGAPTPPPVEAPSRETAARQLFDALRQFIRPTPDQAPPTDPGIAGPATLHQIAGPLLGPDQYALVELLSIQVGPEQRAAAETDTDTDTGNEPIPPETRTALQLASDLLTEPGKWLRTPNSVFGERRPIDLIDTPDEILVFNALNAFQHGLF